MMITKGSDAPKAVSAKQHSEGETKIIEKNEAYCIYAAMSYVVILIVIGIPLWWKTTEVYRVALPYGRISALSTSETSVGMNISVSTLDPARGQKLIADLEELFKTSRLFNIRFNAVPFEKKLLAMVQNVEDLENLPVLSTPEPGELLLLEIPGLSRFTSNQVLVGRKRTVYFSTDTSAINLNDVMEMWLLRQDSLLQTVAAMICPTNTGQDPTARRRIPAAAEYDISVTVVNPEPEKLHVNWNLPKAVQEYIEPFLDDLSPLSGYTVKSQWLYFVTLNVQPKAVFDHMGSRNFALAEDILPQIITPLEKKLASHVSRNPCLNLVVYVPPCDAAPLHIYRQNGIRVKGGVDAFLSPRWGGIVIHNPSSQLCRNMSAPEPKEVHLDSSVIMGVFLTQLRLLLGIPDVAPISRADLLPLTTKSLHQWEFDSLLRIRTLEQLTSAKLTLQSLAQLLGEIKDIVINDIVGDSIYKAVYYAEKADELLKAGNLSEAFGYSREAFLSAEAAFTDPSLLAILYFPGDQKYAVYLPLFLPVMIPAIMSLKDIYMWVRAQIASSSTKLKEG